MILFHIAIPKKAREEHQKGHTGNDHSTLPKMFEYIINQLNEHYKGHFLYVLSLT